jgi:hypothetical protein
VNLLQNSILIASNLLACCFYFPCLCSV